MIGDGRGRADSVRKYILLGRDKYRIQYYSIYSEYRIQYLLIVLRVRCQEEKKKNTVFIDSRLQHVLGVSSNVQWCI